MLMMLIYVLGGSVQKKKKNTEALVVTCMDDGFGGLVVSILATGTRVRGFKPGRKILSVPSCGEEAK
jgi:hypothetical protein